MNKMLDASSSDQDFTQNPTTHGLVYGQDSSSRLKISFEFFPPKSEGMHKTLRETAKTLRALNPEFVSVTCGAGGSDSAGKTPAICEEVGQIMDVPVAAHLTCASAPRAVVEEVARNYWKNGVRRIVALRGDSPDADGIYRPRDDSFAYADSLVTALKKIADFDISVAAYPETHPAAPDAQFDLDHLKRKIDAGANRAITQFFFDNNDFLRFMEKVRAAGITVPVVPGILPIVNFERAVKFAGACGAKIPQWTRDLFEGLDSSPETRQMVSATVAAEQCRLLEDEGYEEFHIYTLNRAELSVAVCRMLGVKADEPAMATA
jgi:methylenetetrahydrofolate reductase (NADPH)